MVNNSGKAMGLSSAVTWPSWFTVRFTMSGFLVGVASVAVGRLDLTVRTICICKQTIMNDASRKNMMSISGMISSRDFFSGMGVRIFMVSPGFAGCRS